MKKFNNKSTSALSKSQILKELIYESAMESTAHSLPYIFKRSNPLIKTFWILCLIASASTCATMITMSIMNYYRYETITKAETMYEFPTHFPAVTICNLNPFQTNYSFDFITDFFKSNNLTNLNDTEWPIFSMNLIAFKYTFGSYLNALNLTLTDNLKKRMGLQIDDMLLFCMYNQIKCKVTDFYWHFDFLYG